MYKIIASLYRYNMRGFNKSIPYFCLLYTSDAADE